MRCRFLFLCALLLPAACTVKEDRVECPCEFTLDLSECDIKDDVLTFSIWDGSKKIVSDYYCADDLGKKYTFKLERKVLRGSAFTGDVNSLHDGRNLLVKYGLQADSLYAWAQDIDATGETSNEIVLLHKQFATVTFDLSEYDSAQRPLRVCLTGNYGGTDILTLGPVRNDFLYEFETDGSRFYPVRLTRQGDNSLTMELFSGDVSVAKINIAAILASEGYDWSAADLADITVAVTAKDAEITVELGPWDNVDI